MRKLLILLTLPLLAAILLQGCSKAYGTGEKEKLPVTVEPAEAEETTPEEPVKPELTPERLELIKLLESQQFYVFEQMTQKYEDFELENLKGQMKKLSQYEGKVIFLNFWATWCGPCRKEMPSMQKLYDELKGDGFEIIAVNLQEEKKEVQKFMDSLKLNFPVLLDKTGQVGGIYGASSIPTTYIFDRKGFVVAGAIGTREWDTPETKQIFKSLLEETK